MERGLKVSLIVLTALALNLSLVSAALAHGSAADGHAVSEGPLGVLLLPPGFVLGVVAFFGVLYALWRHRG